jgi:DNA uptake protein ComE-like DNA-binding protein
MVNLNSASSGELDRLGGGMIGKAIVRGRPYGSPDDLVDKRIVSRATFTRIKDSVTVAR